MCLILLIFGVFLTWSDVRDLDRRQGVHVRLEPARLSTAVLLAAAAAAVEVLRAAGGTSDRGGGSGNRVLAHGDGHQLGVEVYVGDLALEEAGAEGGAVFDSGLGGKFYNKESMLFKTY